MTKLPLQLDRTLFVKIPFQAAAKSWSIGDRFPWQEMNMDTMKVMILYNQDYLMHDDTKVAEMQIGDGLEVATIEQLHEIVRDYTNRVKQIHGSNQTAFEARRPKMSQIPEKQRGLIRSWRNNHLDWLQKAEANKK
jgi:hypothetical protein